MKYCYIVSEGIQDVEFIIRIFKNDGFKRVTTLSSVNYFWKPLIPTIFPKNDNLEQRVKVPRFLENNQISIAIQTAGGINSIAETIQEEISVLTLRNDLSKSLFSIGVVLDADSKDMPKTRFEQLVKEVKERNPELNLPENLEEISGGLPKFGIFVMPDNNNQGTLETILLECAQKNYPHLYELAREYIDDVNLGQLNKKDLKELSKPAGKNKAIISSISSVLKPGRTLQVSIQDNRWLDETTMDLDSLKGVKDFLDKLIT
jgi:hypothetical protein